VLRDSQRAATEIDLALTTLRARPEAGILPQAFMSTARRALAALLLLAVAACGSNTAETDAAGTKARGRHNKVRR
jgi:hypothetical protein